MSSVSDGSVVLGSTVPRLWTPPLRELTPATSFGFDVIDFADGVLAHPLDPWEQWLVVHAGELLPDGRPRFRIVIVLVARQNGKTEVVVVLALYWQFVEAVPLVLGTSTKLDYARESWLKGVKLAEATPAFDSLRPSPRWKREANGEQESWTVDDARYKIAASNAEGGRSLTVHRLVLDELRQHHDYSAWGAAYNAMNAVSHAQAWAMSNAGDDRSVVLNDRREAALKFIESGVGDPRVGLFEWSCTDEDDPLDLAALAQANPNLGRRIPSDALLGEAATAVARGGEALTTFKTEAMCIRVRKLAPAIDGLAWRACHVPGDLAAVRSRVAVCLDVAPDGAHATLVAAAVLADGRVRVEPVRSWTDTDTLRRDLTALLLRVRPKALGWYPSGPAAALAADLAERPGRAAWPPKGMTVEPIKGDMAAVCMGLDEQVRAGRVVHDDDPLLNAHVTGAERLPRGDGWVFSRRGEGHCDAAYAVAGAVHLARTLPVSPGRPRLVVAD
ncbi:terminase [Actinokineospora sp.]|uniref:terminase n=1 Tax=Actinokineospora sp. TaxID=1872133 RepID=UPI003D6C4484